MSNRPKDSHWPAEPHTLAKVQIIKSYVEKWTKIHGQFEYIGKRDLTYIDGFAGPGRYKGGEDGSPIAAIDAMNMAKRNIQNWNAGRINCHFIEHDKLRCKFLNEILSSKDCAEGVTIHDPICGRFDETLSKIEEQNPTAFINASPLLAFLDPFGATGVPFHLVQKILRSEKSELVLNFDTDGLARIYRSGDFADYEKNLDLIFGTQEWRNRFPPRKSRTRDIIASALALYKEQLANSTQYGKYKFQFEMRTSVNNNNYFLLFATGHLKGLATMKESMKQVDQTGNFQFIDSFHGQSQLFRDDDPQRWLEIIWKELAEQSMTLKEFERYVLEETPLVSFRKEILKPAEKRGILEVQHKADRRPFTFPDDKILKIRFIKYGEKK